MNLRELKKHETRLRIQDEAFRLAGAHGFDAITVEDIADAARVSPSTVYRYFRTKEGIFVWDELELPAVEMLKTELEQRTPLDAVLAALIALTELGFHVPDEEMRRRVGFLYEEPSLRAAMGEAFHDFERKLTELFIEEGTADPMVARLLAGMTMTVVAAAIEAWSTADPPLSLAEALQQSVLSLDAVLAR